VREAVEMGVITAVRGADRPSNGQLISRSVTRLREQFEVIGIGPFTPNSSMSRGSQSLESVDQSVRGRRPQPQEDTGRRGGFLADGRAPDAPARGAAGRPIRQFELFT